MKEQHIKALKVTPLERPEICYLKNKLRALQEAVSIGADYVGLIEIIDLDERTCILCNEEGKLIGLMPNHQLESDIICGVFYVTGQDREGNLTSLTDVQIEQHAKTFGGIEYFMKGDSGNIIALRFVFSPIPYKFHNAFFGNLPPVADSESFYPIRVQKLKHRIFAYLQNSAAFFQRHYLGNIFVHKITSLF
jgi:hypothetical protein